MRSLLTPYRWVGVVTGVAIGCGGPWWIIPVHAAYMAPPQVTGDRADPSRLGAIHDPTIATAIAV